LKTLNPADATELFDKEADMLTKFGIPGMHNVRLLAKIVEREAGARNKHSLLFPWAEHDLYRYWEESNKPDSAQLVWISEQCHGLVSALAYIHNPPGLFKNESQLFGRHGDIKPENILWFRNDKGAMLAFSDMGLTEVHNDSSRSNIPGHGIPATPNYRPPECDMAGKKGHISRSFDIWTLGCVFLEFIVWILEGWDGIRDFKTSRFTKYITNVETNIFFSLVAIKGSENKFAFKVQDSVTKVSKQPQVPILRVEFQRSYMQCFEHLHQHKDCTEYIHNFLDIIQKDMLIVQSDDPYVRRIRAPQLLDKMAKLRDRCSKDAAYYTEPCPRETRVEVRPPVEAKLNRVMLESIGMSDMFSRLEIHGGQTRTKRPSV
jgi:serine/threonine protein kinase